MAMIKEMPGNERPREKAILYGMDVLSTRELLALLLRTGTNGESVLQVVDELLLKSKGVSGLERMSRKELCEIRGISDAKAMELLACMELNKRILYEKARKEDVIAEPEHLVQWLQREIGPCVQEKFLAVYLDNCHHILSCQTMFVGTVNMSHVYPRDVLREALRESAVSMIIVHNHPGGSLQPGAADLNVTSLLLKSAAMMGIQIDDHLIITQNSWFSFARAGIIEQMIEELANK
jgi:DNA repair protein RadC